MNRAVSALGAACLAGSLVASFARAEVGGDLALPRCSFQGPRFCADAACFLADSSHTVEVYFSVCNEGLQFVKAGDGYGAAADLSAVLWDGDGHQVAGDTYRIKLYASRYSFTASIDSCQTRVLAFKARPGEFDLRLGLYDRDSRVKSAIETTLRIPALTEYPSLSDVELLKRAEGVHTGERKGYAPNITRIYSAERDSIPFYYEVYHGGAADTLDIAHEVLGADGVKILETSASSAGAGRTAHLVMLPADTLSNGRYTLRVSLRTAAGERGVARSEDFEIRHETFHLDRDFNQAVALLTYLASGGEIDAFEKAGEEERKLLWDEFWREKDPTPGTPRNEFFEEHLRRFRYAEEHYRAPLTEGWRTDRGRIYILYGDPDEVESYPFEMGRKPTEVWHYFGQSRRFVFVDETGFGDYVLVGGGG